ncbi:hypothetical protein IWW50_005527, partial [Coemansia erecta]
MTTSSPKTQAVASSPRLQAEASSSEAPSAGNSPGMSPTDSASASASDSCGEVDSYIASLHLERNNTRVGHRHLIQRRKTLMKQARDPQADQEALEQEIRQVERLASLLGRRQTRFDRKRGAPKVNHDLDATLTGFFDVEENDRVGDILLSARHRHGETAEDDLDGSIIEDPELTAQNIRSAPAALMIEEQQPEECQQHYDPFDKIDEMNIAESPSGSAEYLPLDTYKSEEITVAETPIGAQGLSASSNSADVRVAGGKVAGNIADGDADDEDEDESMLLGVSRSITWKKHSSTLIMEREQFGPALPTIVDEDGEEDDEMEEHRAAEHVEVAPTAAPARVVLARRDAALSRKRSLMRAKVVADALDSLAHAGAGSDSGQRPESKSSDAASVNASAEAASSAAAAAVPEDAHMPDTPSAMEPPTASVVDDYMDILDFMDSSRPAEPSDHDDDHISSDLLGNSSSSSSELDLSATDSSASADSDSHYLARLIPPRRLSVVNVVDAPSQLAAHEPSADAQSPAPSLQPPTIESAAAATAGVLNNRSTLRRNRRIMSRSRGLRGGRAGLLGPRAATAPVAESSAYSSAAESGECSSVANAGEQLALEMQASLSLGPAAGTAEDTRPQTAGLAQLARDAISEADKQANAHPRRIQPLLSSTTRQKPLPPIPDRLSRTLEVADAKAAAQRARPPLPTRERPRLPR